MAYNIISDGTNSNIYQDGTLAYTFVNADTTLSISGHDITFDDGDQTVTIVDELISGVSSTQSRENSIYAQLCEIFNKDAYDAGGGATSFVIASGTVDLSVTGSTELTYATGFDGNNVVPLAFSFERANDTDTYTLNNDADNVSLVIAGNNMFTAGLMDDFNPQTYVFGGKKYVGNVNSYYLNANATDKFTFTTGAEAPSTTEFNVTVKIIGLKTT